MQVLNPESRALQFQLARKRLHQDGAIRPPLDQQCRGLGKRGVPDINLAIQPHLLQRRLEVDINGATLERRVDNGEMAAGFALFPTGMEALMAVADAGEVMPPKSTWFEPKLADGLVSHVLD